MKKIFTILLAFTVSTSLFAQHDEGRRHNDRDNDRVYNNGRYNRDDDHYKKNDDRYEKKNSRYNDRYNANKRELDIKAANINRSYDARIQNIRSNWFMGRNKKERMIMVLEAQRRNELNRLYAGSVSRNDRDDDRNRNGRW